MKSQFLLSGTLGLSQYNKHHYYQSYDVTKQLPKGKNEFLVSLGEGWWSGDITFGNGNWNYFGEPRDTSCTVRLGGRSP